MLELMITRGLEVMQETADEENMMHQCIVMFGQRKIEWSDAYKQEKFYKGGKMKFWSCCGLSDKKNSGG